MNNTHIILNTYQAKSLLQKSVGLIGQNAPKSILIKTRFGIHTFGMKFPIDVLILDKNQQVVQLKQNMVPNRLFFWNPRYNLLLELPVGLIKKKGIKKGSKIKIKLIS